MKIWRLQTQNRSSGYPYVTNEEEVQYYLKIFKQFYQQKKIIDQLQPTVICNLHQVDIGRIILSNQEFWVLTEKAKDLLNPLINQAVEYLPLMEKKEIHKKISRYKQLRQRKTYKPIIETIHNERQLLLNILDIKTSKIIDFEKSVFEYDNESDTIFMIDALAFISEEIQNTHLFKINNKGHYFKSATFVSDEFRKVVQENNLTGLKFSELEEDDGGNLVWDSNASK